MRVGLLFATLGLLAACGEAQPDDAPSARSACKGIAEPQMVWIPSGRFTIGADPQYPEEGPAREVAVAGFWISRTEVTNAQFAHFVAATGYRTAAEHDPPAITGAPPAMRLPGSAVFRVPTPDNRNWWAWVPGASWRHPSGPTSAINGRGADPWALGDSWRAQSGAKAHVALQCEGQRVLGDPFGPAYPNQRAHLLEGGQAIAVIEGEVFHFTEPGAQFDLEDGAGGDEIKAPLPGKLVALAVIAGQMVKKGEPLAVLEAMKMEHALKAPRDGQVAEVTTEIGALVKDGQVLVRLEALP